MLPTKLRYRPSAGTLLMFLGIACGTRTELSGDATPTMQNGTCGNGQLEGAEQCDDSNLVAGDGCSSECLWEPVAIVCGSGKTCAVGANRRLLCWGNNNDGSLGLGDTRTRGDKPDTMGANLPTVDLGRGRSVSEVALGGNMCALLDNHQAKCWGNNYAGQLGQGDTLTRGDQLGEVGDGLAAIDFGQGNVPIALADGSNSTCALLAQGRVKCWGSSDLGQTGYGDRLARGNRSGQMGDALPFVDLGSARTALSVAAGGWNFCALLDDRSIKCWGRGAEGIPGAGDSSNRGDDPGEMGDALMPIDLGPGARIQSFALASDHVCALLAGDEVKCWGANGFGQLGFVPDEAMPIRGNAPGEMGANLPVVDLGTGQVPIQLAAGDSFTCALLASGQVKCWGADNRGQLGLPNDGFDSRTSNRGDDPGEMGDALPALDFGRGRSAKSICAGSGHACALLDNGKVKCWGDNISGTLGVGYAGRDFSLEFNDEYCVGDQAGEMGDNLPAIDLRF
jgi:cysteine-rich repeat protein